MRTSNEYVKGLRKMRRNIRIGGETVEQDDERMMGAIRTLPATFDYAAMSEYEELMTATSHLTGEKINRFCHIHQSPDDLHKKQDMTRFLCQQLGGCVQRCMGIDALNAVSAENQHRLFRAFSDMLCSAYGGAAAVDILHGGGSPIMEKIAITGQYDIEARKKLVKKLAGIKD